MTVQQLFENVKSSPKDVIFSFKHSGKRYQLAAISTGVLDPMVHMIRGAVIICYDPADKTREDRYHFKLQSAKVYVWAFKNANPLKRN